MSRHARFSYLTISVVMATLCVFLLEGTHAQSGGGDDGTKQEFRWREGSKLVEQLGEFREAGGRIAFYPADTNKSLQVLENLALERIVRDLDQRTRKWSVTGTVTEYRGGNYLLLERAVMKTRSDVGDSVPRS